MSSHVILRKNEPITAAEILAASKIRPFWPPSVKKPGVKSVVIVLTKYRQKLTIGKFSANLPQKFNPISFRLLNCNVANQAEREWHQYRN